MSYRSVHLQDILTIHDIYSIHYFEYMCDFSFPGESHDFWEFLCVDKGEVNVLADEKLHVLKTKAIFAPKREYALNYSENPLMAEADDNEITRVSVRFADEDLWLTQNQLTEIYCTTQQNISQHVDNIYKDGELTIEVTNKKFLLVRQEGNRQVKRNIDHYNLDMIIALGYRVQSQVATRFRRWATHLLPDFGYSPPLSP